MSAEVDVVRQAEELLRMVQTLPDEDRGRAEAALKKRGITFRVVDPRVDRPHLRGPSGYVSRITDIHETEQTRRLRWPRLGPGAMGGAVLVGWVVGIVGGPLVAIVGASVGLALGDRLDQHTADARES